MASHGNVKIIPDDSQFLPELTNAGAKLVVVDFTASWCGPCQRIAPVFERLSVQYPEAVFLKVDVDQCQETAHKYGVRAMPTFIFFRAKAKIDEMRGADPVGLEAKVKQNIDASDGGDEVVEGEDDGGGKKDVIPGGYVNLLSFICKSGCECLNESDDHLFSHSLHKGTSEYLESDCDEQLLVHIAFNQPIKLHSFKMQSSNDGSGPKTVKLFINTPQTLDFDRAETMVAVQQVELTSNDINEDSVVPLRYVKFQNVQNVTIFVKDNQGGADTTIIHHLVLYGTPVDSTNMEEFKRVAGKKGESH